MRELILCQLVQRIVIRSNLYKKLINLSSSIREHIHFKHSHKSHQCHMIVIGYVLFEET